MRKKGVAWEWERRVWLGNGKGGCGLGMGEGVAWESTYSYSEEGSSAHSLVDST